MLQSWDTFPCVHPQYKVVISPPLTLPSHPFLVQICLCAGIRCFCCMYNGQKACGQFKGLCLKMPVMPCASGSRVIAHAPALIGPHQTGKASADSICLSDSEQDPPAGSEAARHSAPQDPRARKLPCKDVLAPARCVFASQVRGKPSVAITQCESTLAPKLKPR